MGLKQGEGWKPLPPAMQKEADYIRDLFKQVAARGHNGARLRLGGFYAHGKGVSENLMKAQRYYEEAAERGASAAADQLRKLKKRQNTDGPR